jgi:hypothetical protein
MGIQYRQRQVWPSSLKNVTMQVSFRCDWAMNGKACRPLVNGGMHWRRHYDIARTLQNLTRPLRQLSSAQLSSRASGLRDLDMHDMPTWCVNDVAAPHKHQPDRRSVFIGTITSRIDRASKTQTEAWSEVNKTLLVSMDSRGTEAADVGTIRVPMMLLSERNLHVVPQVDTHVVNALHSG